MSLTTQFYTMIAMIGMGSWLGAALDTYGRFLKRPKRAQWFVFINDILFWVLQGLIIFYTLLSVNEGELRVYVFLALLCGYAAYQSLFRTGYLRLLDVLISGVISTYRFIAKTIYLLIVRPLQLLIQFLIVLALGGFKLVMALSKILYNILLVLLKIILSPIHWIGVLLWKLVPRNLKKLLVKYLYNYAGILRKIKNIKYVIIKWWKKISKS